MPLPSNLEPKRYVCYEFRRSISTGWTSPSVVVARLHDNSSAEIVLKVRDPLTDVGRGHYRGTSLAAELIFAILARALGMSVPDYGIAVVSSEFADRVREPEIQRILKQNT